jgi:hypothetical protein
MKTFQDLLNQNMYLTRPQDDIWEHFCEALFYTSEFHEIFEDEKKIKENGREAGRREAM